MDGVIPVLIVRNEICNWNTIVLAVMFVNQRHHRVNYVISYSVCYHKCSRVEINFLSYDAA